MKKKISVIFGTRPEAIKLCPLILELRRRENVECHVCVTGQHREMLDQVLDIFNIMPDIDFRLMKENQTLGGLTSKAIAAIDDYLTREKPDIVVVQGDTTTVFCGALAAFYHHIPVAHVEAGLRTRNLQSPWPEEANRVLTSRLTQWHFAPTEFNKKNLLEEGVANNSIYVVGNTVIDALIIARNQVSKNPPQIPSLAQINTEDKMVLITGHRRENFGAGFERICSAIHDLAVEFPNVHFVYPVHLNPHVQEPVNRLLKQSGNARLNNIHLIEPLAYLPFVSLMNQAYLILTDSGGVQEEAPSLGKPVLVMRNTTERPEAVASGTVKLVGTDTQTIINEVRALLTDSNAYNKIQQIKNPYGDGQSCKRICDILLQ